MPETRKCAVSPTKIFTNSLFGLCMHWIGSGSKQHKKRRGKLVLIASSIFRVSQRGIKKASTMEVEESGLGEERVADKPLGARSPFTARSHHVRRRPERLNCLRPSLFSARLQFVQKVNRLHFLRRLHFLITSDLKIHAIICRESQLIRSGLYPFRINPK